MNLLRRSYRALGSPRKGLSARTISRSKATAKKKKTKIKGSGFTLKNIRLIERLMHETDKTKAKAKPVYIEPLSLGQRYADSDVPSDEPFQHFSPSNSKHTWPAVKLYHEVCSGCCFCFANLFQRSKIDYYVNPPMPPESNYTYAPNPFRKWAKCEKIPLGYPDDATMTLMPVYDNVYNITPEIPAKALNWENISIFLYNSVAISAWKQYKTSQWSLRYQSRRR
jgi:hypothetical protein